jgi:hypothetical protein
MQDAPKPPGIQVPGGHLSYSINVLLPFDAVDD